jgi:serine/threonine protein kinase
MEGKSLVGTVYSNKYQLVKPIGEGSFGKVFIAKDLMNSTEVAVKLVSYLNYYRNWQDERTVSY